MTQSTVMEARGKWGASRAYLHATGTLSTGADLRRLAYVLVPPA